MLNLLHTALAYARAGWPVFPLHAPHPQGGCTCGHACGATGKHPRTPHGLSDATTANHLIQTWWWRWPDANIGLVTGAASGLVVLDVDPRHGGEESLAFLEAEYDRLPPTLTTHTGGGGRHSLFAHPGGRVPNATALGGWPGLDLRGEGGYIVAPPSLHASGKRYAWGSVLPLAPFPGWLAELRKAPSRASGALPLLRERPPDLREAGAYWLARALEQAHPGLRNATGFWLCCQLRDAGLRLSEAERVLLAYAACVPAGDHPYLPSEALASLRSAYTHPAREAARRR